MISSIAKFSKKQMAFAILTILTLGTTPQTACMLNFAIEYLANPERTKKEVKEKITKKKDTVVGFFTTNRPGTLSRAVGQFFDAISKDDLVAAKTALEKVINRGGTIDTKRTSEDYHARYTALHVACIKGKLETVQFLIDNKASVNSSDKFFETPLHIAATCDKRLEIVKLLVESGADVNSKNSDDKTPLDNALYFRHTDVAEFLVSKDAQANCINKKDSDNETYLYRACEYNCSILVKLLLQRGATVHALNGREGYKKTALQVACENNNVDIVRLLLEKGAQVNVFSGNFEEYTPLHLAYKDGNTALAKLLVAHGADLNAKDCGGKTPAQLGKSIQIPETCKTLGLFYAKRNLFQNWLDNTSENQRTELKEAAKQYSCSEALAYLENPGRNTKNFLVQTLFGNLKTDTNFEYKHEQPDTPTQAPKRNEIYERLQALQHEQEELQKLLKLTPQ